MSKELRPFFCYYGGKWRAAKHYPQPKYNTIIEPFAGAAGYSLRHYTRNIVLLDKDPVIASLWRYLIAAKPSDILALPAKVETTVDDLDICQEAKWLIGFWLNKGSASPCKTPSAWMRGGTRPNSYWGETVREIIAKQVNAIKHWHVLRESYEWFTWDEQPDTDYVTWFIDPPYQKAGKHYKCGSGDIDFANLAAFCKSRVGQVIVCENVGADWLPFRPFKNIAANRSATGGKISAEAIWEQG